MSAEPTQQEGLFAPRAAAPLGVGDPGVSATAPVAGAGRAAVSRRLILRWGLFGMILALLGQMSIQFVGFFWPKKTGAFGGVINAGSVGDYKVGDIKAVQEGKFYMSHVPEGFVALYWKCPHLGCTVPWRPDDPSMDKVESKGRFNCPCHGSIYDRYGLIIQGPAPRPMDTFPITFQGDKILVKTAPTGTQRTKPDAHTVGPNGVTPPPA